MANFAVIENDLVINVIIADDLEIAEQVTGKPCIEYDDDNPAGIGWTYDGESFTPPKIEE